MLIDAFEPRGVTKLAVDSIFMMPHLGVLSSVHEEAATEVFERDCLVYLGTCVAPVGGGKPGTPCATYDVSLPGGSRSGELRVGEIVRIALDQAVEVDLVLRPSRTWDAGNGVGKETRLRVGGGEVGLILDGRGRPLLVPDEEDARAELIDAWHGALELYS